MVATWMGTNPGPEFGPEASVGHWIREIWFRFEEDDAIVRFKTPCMLDPASWSFDIFSPDGRHAALVYEHSVHVVPVQSLRDYLDG
ncbi:MAG: hypothetical protein QUS14_12375, partial [Pyrinomonadaceae bacterium]|nr:hypothetical protein [Pyrinomonadaceae bacterium]